MPDLSIQQPSPPAFKLFDFSKSKSTIFHNKSCAAIQMTTGVNPPLPSSPDDTLTIAFPNDPTGKVTQYACYIVALVDAAAVSGIYQGFNGEVFKNGAVVASSPSATTSLVDEEWYGAAAGQIGVVSPGDVVGIAVRGFQSGAGGSVAFIGAYYFIVPVAFSLQGVMSFLYNNDLNGIANPLPQCLSDSGVVESPTTVDINYGPDITQFQTYVTPWSTAVSRAFFLAPYATSAFADVTDLAANISPSINLSLQDGPINYGIAPLFPYQVYSTPSL
jgi:hypothetical protein